MKAREKKGKEQKKQRQKWQQTRQIMLAWAIIAALLLLIPDDHEISSQACHAGETPKEKDMHPKEMRVREAAVAGSWYPGTAKGIRKALKDYFSAEGNAPDAGDTGSSGRVAALITPHAGWRFSGSIAAAAYRRIINRSYNKVIIIAPSHTAGFRGASIPNATHYRTPLGLIRISDEAKDLLDEDLFSSIEKAHRKEHAIEIELPFLQYALGSFEMIPVLIGAGTSREDCRKIAASLSKHADDKTLIVVSSDFTHYGPNYGYLPFTRDIRENLRALDYGAIEKIMELDGDGFLDYISRTKATICGRLPIAILLYMSKDENMAPELVRYSTSGNMTGDYRNSVSYAAIVFREEGLSGKDRQFLLKLARESLEGIYMEGRQEQIDEESLPDELLEKRGCFVTLNKDGRLRGCIGHILPKEKLYKCVIDNSINAALHDARFSPLKKDELDSVEVEISVLSVPEEVRFKTADDLLDRITPLKDGIVLRSGWHQSTYLPQVWEQLPEKEIFFSRLCLKGGMPKGCWRENSTQVYTYQAEVFSEAEYGPI